MIKPYPERREKVAPYSYSLLGVDRRFRFWRLWSSPLYRWSHTLNGRQLTLPLCAVRVDAVAGKHRVRNTQTETTPFILLLSYEVSLIDNVLFSKTAKLK